MSEPRDKDKLSEDEILKRLVRLARRDSAEEFIRPKDETIGAYLDGSATEAQREEMEQALIASPAFRKEIRDMAIDIGYIEQEDYSRAKESEPEISVPDMSEFLTGEIHRRRPDADVDKGLWRRIVSITRLRVTSIAAVAAAAVIVIVAIQSGLFEGNKTGQLAQLTLVEDKVEAPLLIASTTRDASARDTTKVYETARDAALAAFRSMLDFDFNTGEFEFRSGQKEAPLENMGMLSVEFVDARGNELFPVKDSVPLSESALGVNVTGWLLVLPGRNLYTTELTAETTTIQWPSAESRRGCFAVIFHDSRGFRFVMRSALTGE